MHSNRTRIPLIILLSAMHIQIIPVLHGNEWLDDKVSLCPQAFYLSPNKLHEFVKKKTLVNPPSMLHNSNLYGVVTVDVCVDQKGKENIYFERRIDLDLLFFHCAKLREM